MEPIRAQAVDTAIELTTHLTPALQVQTLTELLPYLADRDRDDRLADCLSQCQAMAEDRDRVRAFAKLVSHLSGARLLEASDIARSGRDERWQNEMRSAVALRLAELGQVEEALDEVVQLSQEAWRADTLVRLARFLSGEDQVQRALESAAGAPHGHFTRTDTTHVRGGKHTVQVAWSAQAGAVGSIAGHVPSGLKIALYEVWTQMLRRMGRKERSGLLMSIGDLHKVARALAGDAASAELSCAVIDAIRWWP